MKRNIIIMMFLLAVLGIEGCTKNYININSDPYAVSEEELQRDGYYASQVLSVLRSLVISYDANTAQFTDCLLGSPMGGYYASTGGWSNTIENYNPTNDWTRVFMKSDWVIPRLYSNLSKMQSSTEDPMLLSIAKIIKVFTMHRVTDTYGPIFYTKIGIDNKLQVPYDSQEAVYDAMFEELNDAIDVLTANKDIAIPATLANAEQIYGASPERWGRLANSLKLRLAMRIVYANEAKAKEMAESAVSHEFGVIASNADNAFVRDFSKDGNPLSFAAKYNTGASTTGGDSHAAADIICYMNGYADPRRAKYFTPCEWMTQELAEAGGITWNSDWATRTYIGKRRGTATWALSPNGRKYSGLNNSAGDPLYWMNAAEVAFLQAEAAAVFGFTMNGTAKSFYEEGVRLSFEQNGVAAGYDAYIADAISTPEAYDDPLGENSHPGKLSEITIAWDDTATPAVMQERIITQKWIANFHLGNEAWCDYRRTGFPKLMPVMPAGNKSGGEITDLVKGARRMRYPDEEYVDNGANVQAAVSAFLGGPDRMSTPVWWDCNPAVWQ